MVEYAALIVKRGGGQKTMWRLALLSAFLLSACTIPGKSEQHYSSDQVVAAMQQANIQAKYVADSPIPPEWVNKVTGRKTYSVTTRNGATFSVNATISDTAASQTAFADAYRKLDPAAFVYTRDNAGIYIGANQGGQTVQKADADAVGNALKSLP